MDIIKTSPCCNCCQRFSIVGVANPLRERIPFLLRCGHSICEKCIYKISHSSRTLKCQTCQNTYVITEEELKSLKETSDAIYQIFPLNFHLLGVLYYNFAKDVNTRQPHHVSYIPAGSNNFPFPQTIVPKQRHIDIPQKNKTEIEKYLMSLSQCTVHPTKFLDLYCEECSKPICALCLVKTCGKHTFIIAQEKSADFEKDILSYKQTVKDVVLRIKKTAVELEKKNAAMMYGSVDVKSIESTLYSHFSHVHGILQKVENALSAELKENKNSLVILINNLYDSTDKLTELIAATELALTPNFKDKVNLCAIAKVLEKAADTPWYFDEDAKNTKPNIELEVDEHIFKVLENHCKLNVENNGLKLLATSELPSYMEVPPVPDEIDGASVKSGVSSDSNANAHRIGHFRGRDVNFDFRPKTNHGPNNAQYACQPKPANTLREKPQVIPIVKQERPIKPLTAGMTEKVLVTHLSSPHDFYVQRLVILPKLKEMSDNYHKNKNDLVTPGPEEVNPGTVFLTYDSTQKRWDRVKVLKQEDDKDIENDGFSVIYIDYGHSGNVKLKRLRKIPKDQFYPIFCLHCTLVDCVPKQEKWLDEDTILMYKIICRSNGECLMYVNRVADDILEVDLITSPHSPEECPTSIKDALIYLEHACLGNTKNEINRFSQVPTSTRLLNRQRISDMEEVIVTNIINPFMFFVRKKFLLDYFLSLSDDLSSTYNLNNAVGTIYTPCKGMYVACFVEDKWWRGLIEQVTGKQVKVFLVDTGYTHVINWINIRKLHNKFFKIDELVTKCKLGGISPVEDKWNDGATEYMRNILKDDPICRIKVIQQSKKKRGIFTEDIVLLTIVSEDICFNTEMIEKGFGVLFNSSNSAIKTNTGNVVVPETKVSILKKPDHTKLEGPLKLEVKILSAISPSEVYVSIKSDDEEELKALLKDMQRVYNATNTSNFSWKKGDKCAVLCPKVKKWNRAIVESVDESSKSAKVFLKDTAAFLNVPTDNLRPLAPRFMNVRDGAIKCHLSGIQPASGNKWPMLTCESLQEMVKSYDRYYITKNGEIVDKSLPIELWVFHTTPGEALTPTRKEWRKLNDKIIEDGLAIPDRSQKEICKTIPKTDSNNSPCNEVPKFDKDIQPPITYDDWLPALPLSSEEFVGLPTYVDDNLDIYLYDVVKNSDTLDLLGNTLTAHFRDSKPKPYDMFWFEGQICIAKYDVDNRYYRAKVMKICDNNKVLVRFVDYGNTQESSISSLRKDIVAHNIPIQSVKCKLQGVKPISESWDQKIGDFVHQSIVDKKCLINIVGEPKDGVTPIHLKINMIHDLAELLLSFRYAQPEDIVTTAFEKPQEKDDDPDIIVVEQGTVELSDFSKYPLEKIDWAQCVMNEEN